MPLPNLQPEQKLLLLTAKLHLEEDSLVEVKQLLDGEINWKKFLQLEQNSGLAPIFYQHINTEEFKKIIPQDINKYFEKFYQKILFDNVRITAAFKQVALILNQHNIDFIPVKGIYLAEKTYGNIALRMMSDIDLLFKNEDIEKVVDLLSNTGWRAEKNIQKSKFIEEQFPYYCPYKLVMNGVVIEVHRALHKSTYSYRLPIADYWKRAKKEDFMDVPTFILNPTDALQHLCVHLFIHYFKFDIRLNAFTDIFHFIEKNQIDWEELKIRNQKANCRVEVNSILFLSKKYFNANIPDSYFKENSEIEHGSDELFLAYLNNDLQEAEKFIKDYNIDNAKNIKGFKNKFLYFFYNAFPSIEYMQNKHQAETYFQLIYFYFLRIFESLGKVLKTIFKR